MKIVKSSVGFQNKFVVDCVEKSGGLTLFWEEDVGVRIMTYTAHHIDAIMRMDGCDAWRLTGMYEWADGSKKCNTLNLIKRLHEEPHMA